MIMEYSAGLTSKLFWVQEAKKHTLYRESGTER